MDGAGLNIALNPTLRKKKNLLALKSEKLPHFKYLLWRGLLWLHVKGKVTRLALLVNVGLGLLFIIYL